MLLFNVLITKLRSLIILFLGCSQIAFAGFPNDLSDVNFVHENVSTWAVTSELDVSIDDEIINLDYDKKTVWGSRSSSLCTGCNANPWVVVKFDEQWWAGTFEWFRFGQTTKDWMKVLQGGNIKGGPFGLSRSSWEPKEGEIYGFFVSGLARFPASLSPSNVRERTNIVLYKWGEGIVTSLGEPEEMCFPIKSKAGKVATICL